MLDVDLLFQPGLDLLVAVAAQLLGDPAPTDEPDDAPEKDNGEAAAAPKAPGDVPPDVN